METATATINLAETWLNFEDPVTRTPPNNLEAERAVLGSLMIFGKTLDKLTALQPEDFYLDYHAQVFKAARNLQVSNKPIDMVSLAGELTRMHVLARMGGLVFLAELEMAVPTAANAEYYGQLVKEASSHRALIAAGAEIAELGYQEDSADELFDRAQARLLTASADFAPQELLSTRDVLNPLWERLHDPAPKLGLKTGFIDVDRLLGGLHRQNLVILAARPGMGKTSWSLNVAEHAASQNVPVAFFSLEMSAEELGLRLACSRAGIGLHQFRNGGLSDTQMARLTQAHGQLTELPLWMDETPALSPIDLRAKARRAKLSHGIGLVIVDYLQLMEPKHQESRERAVAEVSRSLKSLAKELNLPVLACAQLNREAERRADHRPQLSDLRDSGALEMDADAVLFIYRPILYGENAPADVAEIIVGKNRNGPTGMVKLRFDPAQTRFSNRTEVSYAKEN